MHWLYQKSEAEKKEEESSMYLNPIQNKSLHLNIACYLKKLFMNT